MLLTDHDLCINQMYNYFTFPLLHVLSECEQINIVKYPVTNGQNMKIVDE